MQPYRYDFYQGRKQSCRASETSKITRSFFATENKNSYNHSLNRPTDMTLDLEGNGHLQLYTEGS